jgi:hypothetical protein
MADIMEKSLDATSVTGPVATTSSIAPASQTAQLSSLPSPFLGPSLSTSEEILQQAISVTATDGFLTEDELLAASIFFTTSSEDVVRTARTFIALGRNQAVQRRFLLTQLNTAALLPGKGKDKDTDGSMMY